jgi:hypothetical protein
MRSSVRRFWSIAIALVFTSILAAQSPLVTDTTDADAVHVLYTGKLFGYFWVPDAQPPDDRAPGPTRVQNHPERRATGASKTLRNAAN